MAGTLGGALEARRIPAGDGRLQADATGEVEVEDGVLVIKRIAVRYTLRVDPGVDTAAIDRVMRIHASRCPVARSLRGAIDVSTSMELVTE
ncbi:MAG TPA: OsmC family protein [Streptosporangiaceae bacterium]